MRNQYKKAKNVLFWLSGKRTTFPIKPTMSLFLARLRGRAFPRAPTIRAAKRLHETSKRTYAAQAAGVLVKAESEWTQRVHLSLLFGAAAADSAIGFEGKRTFPQIEVRFIGESFSCAPYMTFTLFSKIIFRYST